MRRAAAAFLTAAALVPAGCAARRPFERGIDDRDAFGIYRATVERKDAASRSFRLLLHAAAPDRLHAEVSGPGPGGPSLVVDAGAGRLCLVLPSERVAFVGEATAEVFERLLAVPLVPAEAVDAILNGSPLSPPATVARRSDRTPGLPESLVVSGPRGTLRLDRTALRPLKGDRAALGTARPPPGFEVRPLAEWPEGEP